MGLVIDQDSVEDMLFDLNRDNTNKSVFAKQFGINSLNQQVAQSSIDQAYSEQLMNTYQTYLQNQAQANNLGMIDSLRQEVNQYNYDALSKAYKQSMSEQRNNSYELYNKYLEGQGYIGKQLTDLSEAYGTRADSYLDYMKQAQLDDTIKDYLVKTGIITQAGEVDEDGNIITGNTFADDSVIRNKMFATETKYDENGNVLINKGDLTDEGRAILNMLQSNYTKGDASEKNDLSYDAWIETQDKYKDDRIDKAVMRQMLGIESEVGKQYSKRDMLSLSEDYRNSVVQAENAKLDKIKLENNTAYNNIILENDVRLTSDDVNSIEKDFNQTITDIKSSLSEYGFSEDEFNEFLKSEGLDYTLDTVGKDSLEAIKNTAITDAEKNKESGLTAGVVAAQATELGFIIAAAYHASAAAATTASAFFTFGATSGLAAYHWVEAGIASAGAIAANLVVDQLEHERDEYSKQLDQKIRQAIDPAKQLGIYYTSIKEKFNKFMKESK